MAKLTKIDYWMGRTRCQAQASVDSSGLFSIPYPPEVAEILDSKRASAKTLDECATLFRSRIKEYADAAKKEEKVILLRVNSRFLGSARQSRFGDQQTLDVEAQIMLKTTLAVGAATKTDYREHPDVGGLHCENPIPWAVRLKQFDDHSKGEAVEIPWTQARQDWLVGLIAALRNICELLGAVTEDSDTLLQRMARGLLLGPPPAETDAHSIRQEKP